MSGEPSGLEEILEQARGEIGTAATPQALTEVRARYLGRKGSISTQLRSLGSLNPAERKSRGQAVNAAKQQVEDAVAMRRAELEGGA